LKQHEFGELRPVKKHVIIISSTTISANAPGRE